MLLQYSWTEIHCSMVKSDDQLIYGWSYQPTAWIIAMVSNDLSSTFCGEMEMVFMMKKADGRTWIYTVLIVFIAPMMASWKAWYCCCVKSLFLILNMFIQAVSLSPCLHENWPAHDVKSYSTHWIPLCRQLNTSDKLMPTLFEPKLCINVNFEWLEVL